VAAPGPRLSGVTPTSRVTVGSSLARFKNAPGPDNQGNP
jgi:hypothetical protein